LGFTNPPIGEALAFGGGEQLVVTLAVFDAQSGAAVVADSER
jgi:hypothetical protein